MAKTRIKTLPLATQANPAKGGLEQAEILENGYVEPRQTDNGTVLEIHACPGLNDFATLASGGATRAMHPLDNELLVVTGRSIRRVDASGTETIVGGLSSDGPVTTAQNRQQPNNQVAICCDGLLTVYQGGTLTPVTDPDLIPPNSVAFHDGYILTSTPSGRMQSSAIDEATAWDALDFATAEANPDGLLRVLARGADIVATGPKSTEFWQGIDTDVAFPYARSTAINSGCLAAAAVAETPIVTANGVAAHFIWPATDPNGKYAGICALDGYSLAKISTYAVDRDIEDEPDKANLQATSWVQGGHGFYCISGTSFSWQYDTSTTRWIRRTSYGARRWRVSHVVPLGQRLIAGHYASGKLFEMSRDAHSEGSDPLIWTVQTPRFDAFPTGVEFNTVWADAIPGVGLNSGVTANDNPHLMMQFTEDGVTWSTERWRSFGRQGANRTELRWNALGTSRGRGRIHRFRASAAVVRGLRGASADVMALAA